MRRAPTSYSQMLCVNCFRVGSPDTWIPGSDRLELAAWCCLGLPGLLYCLWRHLARAKVCAHCESLDLFREARASKRPARMEGHVARLRSAGGCPWPATLRAPRERLRSGAALAAAGTLCGLSAGLGLLHGAVWIAPLLGAWFAIWLCLQLGLFYDAAPLCRAWDDAGRALQVEMLAS